MADSISSWIAKLIIQHDKHQGASFKATWAGHRNCQVVKFESYRSDENPRAEITALATDADHSIHLIFDVAATDEFEQETGTSLTSHLRSVVDLRSFQIRLLPPVDEPNGLGPDLPRVALYVLDWEVVSGDKSNAVFFDDVEEIGADPVETEIREIFRKWWTGNPPPSLPPPEPTPAQNTPTPAQTKESGSIPSQSVPPKGKHQSIPLEQFLEHYIDPEEGKTSKTIPDWLFEKPEAARQELETINVFGIDLHREGDTQPEPEASGGPSSPAFPQPGQRLPGDIQTTGGPTQSSRFEHPQSDDSDGDIQIRPIIKRQKEDFFDDTLGPPSSPPAEEFNVAHSQARNEGDPAQDSDLDELASENEGVDDDDLSDYSRQQRVIRREAHAAKTVPAQTIHIEEIQTRSIEISVEVPVPNAPSDGTQEEPPAGQPQSQPTPNASTSQHSSANKSQPTSNGPASQPQQESNSLTESFSASQKSTEEFSLSRYADGQESAKTPSTASKQQQPTGEEIGQQDKRSSPERPREPLDEDSNAASQPAPSLGFLNPMKIFSAWRRSRSGSAPREDGEEAPAERDVVTAKEEHISPVAQTRQPLDQAPQQEDHPHEQNVSQHEPAEKDEYEWPDNFPPPPSPPPARHLAFNKGRFSGSGGKFTPTTVKRDSGVGSSGRRTFTPTIVRRSSPDVFGSRGVGQASPTVSRLQGVRRTREEFEGGDLPASQAAKQSRIEQEASQDADGDAAMEQDAEVVVPLVRPAPGEKLPKIGGFRPDLRVKYGLDANWVLSTAEKAKKQRAGAR